MEKHVRISKYLSLILRHKPEVIGITIDKNGWADVDKVIAGISKKYEFNMEMLREIVDTDEKQRYSFNNTETKIRANQGHSIYVDVELTQVVLTTPLYHGTGAKYMSQINDEGLKKMSRLYVHMTDNFEAAVKNGKRHGISAVYRIKAGEMSRDGYQFYKSANGVYLTDHVPAEYLELIQIGEENFDV